MNENYGMYLDRIHEKKLNNKIYSKHIINFDKLTRGEDITKQELKLIIEFYEQLLNYIDKILKNKFYLGKKFNETEIKIIDNICIRNKMSTIYNYKIICIYVPKEIFDRNKFIKYYDDDNKHSQIIPRIKKTESYYVLDFKNKNKNFHYNYISNVLCSCNKSVSFGIDYNASIGDILFINLDY